VATVVEASHLGAVNIALPTIAEKFDSDLPTVQWVTLGHLLAISGLLLPMGRLSDIVGRKRVFLWGVLALSLGSALAGAAPSLTVLILFRVLQGAGPAMIIANQMAIVTSLFPDRERGTALGLNMLSVGVGLVSGPALGGLMVNTLGWRFVFFVYAPLGALCLVPALIVLDDGRLRQGIAKLRLGSFDWLGAALSALALLVFLLAMTNGHRLGWASPLILTGLAASAGLLGCFVWWELRTPSPLFDLTFFKAPLFSIGVAGRGVFFLAAASPLYLMPFYLQGVAGYTPGQAGLVMASFSLATIVGAPVGGSLTDRFGWKPVALGGATLASVGLLLLSRITAETPLVAVVLLLVAQNCGYAVFIVPINSAVLGSVERSRHSVVVAFLQLLRNAFTVTGIAIATVIVTATMASRGVEPSLSVISGAADTRAALAFTHGLRAAFLAMGSMQLIATALLVVAGRWFGGALPERTGEPRADHSPSE
jgi:EmrB/QacA subfamily drug resistance transporter